MDFSLFFRRFLVGLSTLCLLFLVSGCFSEPDLVILNHNKPLFVELYVVNESGGEMVALTTSDVYENLTGFMLGSNNGNWSNYDAGVVVPLSDFYEVDYSISFSGGNNNLYGISVGVDGVKSNFCYSHRTTFGEYISTVGGTCILNLTSGSVLTLMMADEADPIFVPAIYMVQFRVVQI